MAANLQVDMGIGCEEMYLGLDVNERAEMNAIIAAEIEEQKRIEDEAFAKTRWAKEPERSTRYGIDDEDFAGQCPHSRFE